MKIFNSTPLNLNEHPLYFLPDVTLNQTETVFSCPWFKKCTTFNSLEECLAQKENSTTAMECVQVVMNRTVEYIKKCMIGVKEECHVACSDSSHRKCISNKITCTSFPVEHCNMEPTGRFIDGSPTIQAIKDSGIFTEEPLSYVQILGIAVVTFVILGGILSLKENHLKINFFHNEKKEKHIKVKETT